MESAQPRVRFEVRDDFQVQSVVLNCRSDAEPEKVYQLPIAIAKAGASLSFNYLLGAQKTQLPWKEGTTLTWWIEAKDNNSSTGPGIGRSSERQWNIVSLESKRQEIRDKINKSAETMQELYRTQERLRKGVGDILQTPSIK